MTSSLIFDLVARDKGFDSTMAGGGNAVEKLAKRLDTAGRRSGQGFTAAAREIGATLEQIERDAWESGKGTDEAFKAAVRDMRSDFERLREAGRLTGASLESDLGRSLRDMKNDVDQFADEAKKGSKGLKEGFGEAFDGISDMFGGAFGDVGDSVLGGIGAAKAGFLGAGAAAVGFLVAGMQAEMQEDKIGALIAAQTGSAASQAERLGNVAGDVFVAGFGDSIDQVGEAVTAALNFKLVDTSESEAAIERVTTKVLTLATATGGSVEEIGRSARNLLINDLAGNVSQALDMIQHASDTGLNYADDLFDTITEYGMNFRQLGLDGADAFGLIGQAAEGGARNTDYAADALKEFGIRAKDMSAITRRGFETVGLDADLMGRKIAAGGSQAHDALRQTLNALQTMPSAIERDSAAVDLFGTKAEDLGTALYDMDLDNASDQFGEFAGSVEEAAQKLQNGKSGVDKFNESMKSVQGNLGEFLDWATSSDELDAMTQQANEFALAIDKWQSTGDTSWLDELKAKYPEMSGAIDQYVEKNRAEVEAHNRTTGAVKAQLATYDDLISKYNEMAGGVIGLSEAQIRNQEALAAANEAATNNAHTLDLTTEAGRNNQSALNDVVTSTYSVIDAMRSQGATSQEVEGFVQSQHDAFIQLATTMGMDATAAEAMARKLGLIPGNYAANAELNGVDAATQRAIRFKAYLDSIPPNKIVNLRVNSSGSGLGGHFFAGMASGGQVDKNTPYVVGEEGYELFVPDSNGTIVPHDALMAQSNRLRPASGYGAGAGGGGGALTHMLEWSGGPADDLGSQLFDYFRNRIKFRHGGNVAKALGQRGVA